MALAKRIERVKLEWNQGETLGVVWSLGLEERRGTWFAPSISQPGVCGTPLAKVGHATLSSVSN